MSGDENSSSGMRPYALRRFDETPGDKVVVGQSESPEIRLKRRETEASERGYQAGLEKGAAEANARVNSVIDRLTSVIRNLENHASRQAEELAPLLVGLSVEIAEKVIHKSLELDREVVLAIAHDALQKVAETQDQVVIRVNPADYDLMRDRLTTLRESSGLKGITIEPDGSISTGGCYVETPSGAIDARIEEQLREAEDAVRTALNS